MRRASDCVFVDSTQQLCSVTTTPQSTGFSARVPSKIPSRLPFLHSPSLESNAVFPPFTLKQRGLCAISTHAHCFFMVLSCKALNSPWCTRHHRSQAPESQHNIPLPDCPSDLTANNSARCWPSSWSSSPSCPPGPLRAARNWSPSQFGRVSRDAPSGGDAGRWLAARMEIPCAVSYSRRMCIVIHGVDNNTLR